MEDGAEVQTVQRRSQWCVQVQVAGCLFPYFLGIFVTCADLKRISTMCAVTVSREKIEAARGRVTQARNQLSLATDLSSYVPKPYILYRDGP